jgi:choline dehydrogenase-like flavoprotein
VLDGDFRVHGTRGLRVVDASVFPRIPGFFVVTAIYMAAEKASAAILADAGGPPSLTQPASYRLPRPRKPARPTTVQENR